MVGKRATAGASNLPRESQFLNHDVEDSGRPEQDRKYRFRDNGDLDPDDQRRVEFKKKLLDGVENADANLEAFRKSDEEVSLPPNSLYENRH